MSRIEFEIYVQPAFSHLELSAVTTVLKTANKVLNKDLFHWHITSDMSGLVSSEDELLVRTEPVIGEQQYLPDCLVVVGGSDCSGQRSWPGRIRAMQRMSRPVVLFSEAASKYIKITGQTNGALTTHWRDIPILMETGYYPTLTSNLAEMNKGILTCAGEVYAIEAIIRLISIFMTPSDSALLANLLLVDNVRAYERGQPKGMSDSGNFLERRLQQAIAIMEETAEHPVQVAQIASEVGVSPRQLERLFSLHLNQTPARFYKMIRVKRAHVMITETRMPLSEIAIACGFASASSLAQAYRKQFGQTPKQAGLAARAEG